MTRLVTTPHGARPAAPPLRPLMRELRGTLLAGAVVIGLSFGGFGGWAALAPLASAAIAPGVVSPEGSRRTVQHLEGGIVREILVKDGSVARRGDPLILLESVQARTAYDAFEARLFMLTASQARLLAEQGGAGRVQYPAWLVAAAEKLPVAAKAIADQERLFDARRRGLTERKAILRQQIGQLEQQIRGAEAQMAADAAQLGLIAEEARGVEELLKKGLERRGRLLGLQRASAGIAGNRAERQATIASSRQKIAEIELQIAGEDSSRLEEIHRELIQARNDLAEIGQKLAASRDVLQRTVITAPIDGTVVELRQRTLGGVIRPGEPILDIVPADEELLIDVQVSPTDIDEVRPGLPCQVALTAFKWRSLPRVEGRLRDVSADAILDEKTGRAHYRAKVTVGREELAKLGPGIALTPGMPAEVFITTGESTALAYLLRPITDRLQRAFRES